MKLTNTIRDAFIRRVMDDTPSVDYSEQISVAVVKAAVDLLPPKVASIWKDKSTRNYVRTKAVFISPVGGIYVPCHVEGYCDQAKAFDKQIESIVSEIVEKARDQKKMREDLRSKIRRAAYGYTTRKALADAMPEFAKYLPEDEASANRSLPVVANVVADFVKAGWPKGKGTIK